MFEVAPEFSTSDMLLGSKILHLRGVLSIGYLPFQLLAAQFECTRRMGSFNDHEKTDFRPN